MDEGGTARMSSRKEVLLLTVCAILMVALGGGALFCNWVSTDPFTADYLPDDRVSMQEYEVYCAVINSIEESFHRHRTNFSVNDCAILAPHTYTLAQMEEPVRDYIRAWDPQTKAEVPLPRFSQPLEELIQAQTQCAQDELANFIRLNSKEWTLGPYFVFSKVPYSFTHSPHPNALVSEFGAGFSRVGFSHDMKTAIVCFGIAPEGPLTILRLKREKDRWRLWGEHAFYGGTVIAPICEPNENNLH